MLLKGCCQCGKVKFTVEGGASDRSAFHLIAAHETLKIEGTQNITSFNAIYRQYGRNDDSTTERCFCQHCGTTLWLYSKHCPDFIYPHIDALSEKPSGMVSEEFHDPLFDLHEQHYLRSEEVPF